MSVDGSHEGKGCSWIEETTSLDITSIRQSVQNGQFLTGLGEQSPDMLIAPHADQRVERLVLQIVETAEGGVRPIGRVSIVVEYVHARSPCRHEPPSFAGRVDDAGEASLERLAVVLGMDG